MFSHEAFGPYKAAVDFIALANDVAKEIPRGHSDLLDQLRRAATSIALNIAEGTGRTSKTERKRFYSIARGSALECAAILDVLDKLAQIDPESKNHGREKLKSITAILTSICRP